MSALSKLDHPNIVRLLGYCKDGAIGYLVYEYAAGGTLSDVLLSVDEEEQNLFHWRRRVRCMEQVALALRHCHTRSTPIKHRDIKPENICFVDAEYRTPILIDFGIATESDGTLTTIGGTKPYMAPEYTLTNQGKQYYTEATEVYAFGVLMISLLTSQTTPSQLEQRKNEALTNLSGLAQCADADGGKWDMSVLKSVVRLIGKCLDRNPSSRPSFESIIEEFKAQRDKTMTQVLPAGMASVLSDAVDASFGGSTIRKQGTFCKCGQPSCLSCTASMPHHFCTACLEASVEAQLHEDAIRCHRKGCECIFDISDLKDIIDDELLAEHAVARKIWNRRQKGRSQMTSILRKQEEKLEVIMEKVATKEGIESLQSGIAFLASKKGECPNLCVLVPVTSARFSYRRPFSKEYRLHFLCAYDRSPTSTSIEVRKNRKWVRKAAPVLQYSLLTLSIASRVMGLPIPIPIPGLGDDEKLQNLASMLPEVELDDIEETISTLEDLKASDDWTKSLHTMLAERENQLDASAQAAISKIAHKTENLGWKDEMDPWQRGHEWAWVKKENATKWQEDG